MKITTPVIMTRLSIKNQSTRTRRNVIWYTWTYMNILYMAEMVMTKVQPHMTVSIIFKILFF